MVKNVCITHIVTIFLLYLHIVNITIRMNKKSFWYRAFDLYYDGFRSMTLGKKLWLVIFIKLFIMFAILKVFFFPNFLKANAPKGGEADYVSRTLDQRQK